jgi:dihydrofolate synthase/folylpolyglutamate synthase
MRCASYQEVLDAIYRSYMAAKPGLKGKHDRRVRRPERIVSIAARLGLIPPPQKIVRVTGSKGKGTTARLIAAYLQATTNQTVGLLVSPEEIEHTDRMRIDGHPISEAEMTGLFNELSGVLDGEERALPSGEYLSPSGLFLLLSLLWFRRRDVGFFVLEGGRGVLYDEVGRIPSAVGVVTSILLEHADYLGPTLADIARDKLAIAANSAHLVIPESVAKVGEAHAVPLGGNEIIVPRSDGLNTDPSPVPRWLLEDARLAAAAASVFLDCSIDALTTPDLSNVSASFGTGSLGATRYAFEAIVNLDSLDQDMFARWRNQYGELLVIASLPDDKDRDRLLAFFTDLDCRIVEVVLEGTRGYLDYTHARRSSHDLAVCDYRNPSEFAARIIRPLQVDGPDVVYFAGTHTFIRLVKLALRQRDGGQSPQG